MGIDGVQTTGIWWVQGIDMASQVAQRIAESSEFWVDQSSGIATPPVVKFNISKNQLNAKSTRTRIPKTSGEIHTILYIPVDYLFQKSNNVETQKIIYNHPKFVDICGKQIPTICVCLKMGYLIQFHIFCLFTFF